MPKVNTYLPIWEALKAHGTVTITAPKHEQKRVCKGVIQAKWKDKKWKQQEGWRMKYLYYVCFADSNEITFYLEYKTTDILSTDL